MSLPVVAIIAGHHIAAALVQDERALVLVETSNTRTDIGLIARAPSGLQQLEAQVRSLIPSDPSDCLHTVVVWRRESSTGPAVHTNKPVVLPRRTSIESNYPVHVRSELDRVMRLALPAIDGRLLLWYRPPGTSTTTAALALLADWLDWCDGHLATDPKRLFEDSSYLLDLLLTESRTSPVASINGPALPERRWKR